MRVSLVTETYFPQVNGVSRTLGELVRHLTERGDAVQLIHPDYGQASRGAPESHAVRSVVLPFYKELFLPLPPFGGVRRAIDVFRPDLVHIATEATLGLSVLRFALRRAAQRRLELPHELRPVQSALPVGWARGTIERYLRWFHNRTRETYVPSRATIAQLEGSGFERLVLWQRGVDATMFRPDRPGRHEIRRALGWAPEDPVIGYVSRIAPEKNVDYLADALAIVASRRPDVRMLMVGDGPSRAALERRLGGAARFVGYKTGQDVADHYAAADIFAFASLTETFGNVVLEAKASGLPVVALRAGGVGETVRPGQTGLLVEPSEPPDRMAAALLSLIERPDERRRWRGPANMRRARAGMPSWAGCGIATFPSSIRLSTDSSPARSQADSSARRRCRPGRLESPEFAATYPQAGGSRRRQIVLRQEGSESGERGITREDQLRRPCFEGRHDLGDTRADQRVIAAGLVAQEVVHEEMPSGAVQPRVEIQRALPAPDVKVRVVPDPRAAPAIATQVPEDHPLPATLVADRQFTRRDAQVDRAWITVAATASSRIKAAPGIRRRAALRATRGTLLVRRSGASRRPARPQRRARRPGSGGDNSAASTGRAGPPGARREGPSGSHVVAHRSRRRERAENRDGTEASQSGQLP